MIKLSWIADDFTSDLVAEKNIEQDNGLETAVIISLFTDRVADPVDGFAKSERRGWWGDSYSINEDEKTGSKLWMLSRRQITASLISQIETTAKNSMQWMLDDGVASKITVKAIRLTSEAVGVKIDIYKPDGDVFHYESRWEALKNGV